MKKKITPKKLTLEDLSIQIDTRIRETNNNLNTRVDDLRQHVDRRFEEQTNEISEQIQDILELVDNRFKPLERARIL